MRKLYIGMALASTVLATPALARDDSWYIEADAGGTLVEDMYNLVSPGFGTLNTKTGYDVGGIIGYDFGGFRLEAETSYRRNGVESFNVNSLTTYAASAGNLTGNVSSLSFMLNGLLDFGDDDGLQGFVGGGAGIGRVKVVTQAPGVLYDINDSDSGFAWQALAGVRYPITDHVDLGLKYRFHNQDHVNLVGAGRPIETRYRSHSLMLTLGYNFGGTPAPIPVPVPVPVPPPPPPPPPPPAPEAPVCNKGPYIVFFDWDKSDITPEAASILDSAVTAYGNCANVPIMLAGYADRSGAPTYNQGLSERRNASVTGYLSAHGIPSGAMSSQGFGESNNRVPTADGVRELQNRRVEITYGPGSGM